VTFEEWWRENEAPLSAEHYSNDHWTGIYELLREAHKAGRDSILADITKEHDSYEDYDEWSVELLVAKSVVEEIL